MLKSSVCIALYCLFLASLTWAGGEAPKDGMVADTWSSGIKQAFGTSYEAYDPNNRYSESSPTAPISKVWFTAAQGVVTEVFWPTVDTPQIRDSQFLITDGATFFLEERKNLESHAEWAAPGVPAFKITNKDSQNRFVIERTLFTDPDRDVLIVRVKIKRNIAGLKFYLLHNPSAANSPLGDSAQAAIGIGQGSGLFAWQGSQAQAVVFSVPLAQATAGFAGTASDGFKDVSQHLKLVADYATAHDGNVVLTARPDLPEQIGSSAFDIAIGFGSTIAQAEKLARQTLAENLSDVLNKYGLQWQTYQKTVRDLSPGSGDQGVLYRASVATIKSMEDKTFAGAFVASPTVPWGDHRGDASADSRTAGYHIVWPRDLYQMASSFLAIDDQSSALASLNYLRQMQFGPGSGSWPNPGTESAFGSRRHLKNGSFPQNFWVDGRPYWPGLQLDETAFPILLTYRLWKAGKIQPRAYWDMVMRAADFISEFGPWTQQERWEESSGASPSTIAAEIASLWTAAEIADQLGETTKAQQYRLTADAWNSKPGDHLEDWAFTTSGTRGNGRYFIRCEGASSPEAIWNPNGQATFNISNGGGMHLEKDVLDGGFLELVRLGVRSALDRSITDTVQVYDQSLSVQIPGKGVSFRRYVGDLYNYTDVNGSQTRGMPWVLLTGERGHFELAKALASQLSTFQVDQAVQPYIQAMEKLATIDHFIPEQVWDAGPGAGQSTGSATPLGWAHGEYIKLLRSRMDRAVFDRVPPVTNRQQALSRLTWDQIRSLLH